MQGQIQAKNSHPVVDCVTIPISHLDLAYLHYLMSMTAYLQIFSKKSKSEIYHSRKFVLVIFSLLLSVVH